MWAELTLVCPFTDQKAEKMQDDSDELQANGHMSEWAEAKEVIWVMGASLSHSAFQGNCWDRLWP